MDEFVDGIVVEWSVADRIDPVFTRSDARDGTRVGCPWRDVPPQYGSSSAVYGLFRRWQLGGVWLVIWQFPCASAGRFQP
ncbi:transposase [Nocardia sp. NPDC006982]